MNRPRLVREEDAVARIGARLGDVGTLKTDAEVDTARAGAGKPGPEAVKGGLEVVRTGPNIVISCLGSIVSSLGRCLN